MQQKRGRFYLGERGRRIKIITAFIALLILVAIAAIPLVLPLDSGSDVGSVITEESFFSGKWIPKNDTPKQGGLGEAIVGTGSYIYAIRSSSTGNSSYFWKYDPLNDTWSTLKRWDDSSNSDLDLPRPKSGTALAWDNNTYIYIMFGGAKNDSNRKYFYRYNITDNSWKPLNDTPHSQGAGDAITWANGSIYAMMGSRWPKHNGTRFARYNCSNNNNLWENLTLKPNWNDVTDDGASLVWTGGNYLYALQGEVGEYKNKPHKPITNFSRYNISNNSNGTWEDMRPIPEIEGVGDGGSLLWIGNWLNECSDYIFALGGGSGVEGEAPGYNFYAYNISNNSWENLTSIPCPIGEWVGNRLGFADGHIYYWQGTPKNTSKWICGGDAFLMFAQTGSISVSSSPSGAKIFLDGSYKGKTRRTIKGKTQRTIIDVSAGHHTIELSLDGCEDWSTSVHVTAGETSDVHAIITCIVINEVELNPPGHDNLESVIEWVELYNPTSKDVDLTGWRLSSTQAHGGETIDLFGTIKANGYRVFGRSRWLHNTKGESVILRDAGSKKIDSTPFLKDRYDDYRSWQRCPNGIDTDSSLDWKFRLSTWKYSNKCS